MTKPEFDSMMNSIVIDFCFIFCIEIFGLIAFGTIQENGNQNTGSLYGLFALPLVPVILIALGLIQVTKSFLKAKNTWLSSFAPSVLAIIAVCLKPFLGCVLISCLSLIILCSILKQFLYVKSPTKTLT